MDGKQKGVCDMKDDDTNMIDFVCSVCGSNHVVIDAYAEWCVESQDWELCSTYQDAYCTMCDKKTHLEEVVLPNVYLRVVK